MKRLAVIAAAVTIAAVLGSASVSEQFADAGSRKKIHFTQTIESSPDPGRPGQMALILSPNEGTIYDGSVTYAASGPAELAVFHEAEEGGSVPTWSADGKSHYAVSLFEAAASGSLEFTGAALALRSDEEFAVTVSVDAWTRGQPAEILVQKIEAEQEEFFLPLARANVPATIPLHKGMHAGGEILYMITDGSDEEYAKGLSQMQGWRVELAESLAEAPEEAVQRLFIFRNGIEGGGIYGFQDDLFSATPEDPGYSALSSVTEVTWKTGQKEIVFESAAQVIAAEEKGRILFEETGVILNAPHISWPGGQMAVRPATNSTAPVTYDGGQITEINTDEMTVTFVAHRGWGPDGQTVYYIVTDATPPRPAEAMGIVASPTSAALIDVNASADLFQFKNGVRGPGPLGFQPIVAAAALGDRDYTPMWRIHVAEWHDPGSAKILETLADIDAFREEGSISAGIARPTNADHIVNCPFIDPFQR